MWNQKFTNLLCGLSLVLSVSAYADESQSEVAGTLDIGYLSEHIGLKITVKSFGEDPARRISFDGYIPADCANRIAATPIKALQEDTQKPVIGFAFVNRKLDGQDFTTCMANKEELAGFKCDASAVHATRKNVDTNQQERICLRASEVFDGATNIDLKDEPSALIGTIHNDEISILQDASGDIRHIGIEEIQENARQERVAKLTKQIHECRDRLATEEDIQNFLDLSLQARDADAISAREDKANVDKASQRWLDLFKERLDQAQLKDLKDLQDSLFGFLSQPEFQSQEAIDTGVELCGEIVKKFVAFSEDVDTSSKSWMRKSTRAMKDAGSSLDRCLKMPGLSRLTSEDREDIDAQFQEAKDELKLGTARIVCGAAAQDQFMSGSCNRELSNLAKTEQKDLQRLMKQATKACSGKRANEESCSEAQRRYYASAQALQKIYSIPQELQREAMSASQSEFNLMNSMRMPNASPYSSPYAPSTMQPQAYPQQFPQQSPYANPYTLSNPYAIPNGPYGSALQQTQPPLMNQPGYAPLSGQTINAGSIPTPYGMTSVNPNFAPR